MPKATELYTLNGWIVHPWVLTQLYPILLQHCSLPGPSVHGIIVAWILQWVAISSSRGIFLIQGLNPCLLWFLLWQADSLPLAPPGKPGVNCMVCEFYLNKAVTKKCLRASLMAQIVKNLPSMQETWVGKLPWRREWQPTPVFYYHNSWLC